MPIAVLRVDFYGVAKKSGVIMLVLYGVLVDPYIQLPTRLRGNN